MIIYRFNGAQKPSHSMLFRLIAGIGIFLIAIAAFVLMAYLLVFGAVAAVVIYAIMKIKNKFFPRVKPDSQQNHQGRIIDLNNLD